MPAKPLIQPKKGGHMRSIVLLRVTATALFAVLAMPAQIVAQEEQEHKQEHFPHYRVKDLGTLGGTFSMAFGLNDKGHVGGGAGLPNGSQHAFLWTKGGGLKGLGTLGGPNSIAGGPNEKDALPIEAETSKPDPLGEDFCGFGTGLICLGAVWKNGAMTPLSTLGGNNAYALGINNKGHAVGIAENDTQDSSCTSGTPSQVLRYEGVIWDANGKIRELPPLPGDTVGFALGINNQDQTVGGSGTCSNTPLLPLQIGPHAVFWKRDGSPVDLGSLGGKIYNTAAALNDRGEVVGGSNLSGDKTIHTFLWTKERGMRDLGTVGSDLASLPGGMGGINNKGQVVGQSCDADPLTAKTPPNCRAYLWQNGDMKDINSLIPADSTLHLVFGFGINESGEITGYAVEKSTGDVHAFLAVPCDRDDDPANGCDVDDK
jgi:probable HAF family extracellular repeat protein